jgi:hypothetical protein
MCFFKAPKIEAPPAAPQPAQRQAIRLPDNGAADVNRADEIARKRRALATTAFTGALNLGSPSTTSTVLGG